MSDTFSPELYALIVQQAFFKGLTTQQLELLAASALEMVSSNVIVDRD
jgi:hypothetical protein